MYGYFIKEHDNRMLTIVVNSLFEFLIYVVKLFAVVNIATEIKYCYLLWWHFVICLNRYDYSNGTFI